MRQTACIAALLLAASGCDDRVTPYRVLVADPELGQVRAFDHLGSDEGSWFDATDLPAELQIRGLRPTALRAQDGVIWVAHDGDPAVFAADGHGWLGPVYDNAERPVRIEEPCAFAETPDGPWLLANDSRTAVRLDPAGQVTARLSDEISDPHGIARLDGHLYVVTSLRTRETGALQRFDADGTGRQALTDAPLLNPVAVLPHDGALLIADWGAGRVVRLDAEGALQDVLIDTPRPVALALDPDGRLLILGDEGLLRLDPRRPARVERLTDPSPFARPRNLLVVP